MHLLAAQPGGFVDDAGIITRLEQTPADIVILSAADTTLALLSSQHPLRSFASHYPSVRLANLQHLRQPASVDLYIEEVLQHASLIIIDHLGGESYWPYGTDQIVKLCNARQIALVMFSGDATEDTNLLARSTIPADICRQLWRYLREGGNSNAQAFYKLTGSYFFALQYHPPAPEILPEAMIYHPREAFGALQRWRDEWVEGAPVVALLFYRSHVQAGNTPVFDALCTVLQRHGLNPLPIALASLKNRDCMTFLREHCRQQQASLILNTTSFSVMSPDQTGDCALVDDLPVLQLILSGNNKAGWLSDPQGLQARDIAMNVALPEVDGRIITRAVSFKGLAWKCELTQADIVSYQPHAERMDFVAQLTQRWCHLRQAANADKRIAMILANYPRKEGRIGNGVGLDTPASLINLLNALQDAGYTLDTIPADGEALMQQLTTGVTNDERFRSVRPAFQSLSMADYLAFYQTLPEHCRNAVESRWGQPHQDGMVRQQRFMISGVRCGHVFIGIQPSRSHHDDPLAHYHDALLPPTHHYIAFYCWLRRVYRCDAIVHLGKHGTLEWLPGKSVALSDQCWPDLLLGPTPHIYPFIVNDPGEGAQAKRRTQAVIIDHLMPPLTRAGNYGKTQDLERKVDEYYEALSFDARRANVLRGQILEMILADNLHNDLGVPMPQTPEQEQVLLNRTDAWLCELKESQIRDGLHVFGASPTGEQQRDTLLALARYPVGDGRNGNDSLIRALARDLLPDSQFDPLDCEWDAPWSGPRPDLLKALDHHPWRHAGDTRERLELFALECLENPTRLPADTFRHAAPVLARVQHILRPLLEACGPTEMQHFLRALSGCFIPPGPSGAPSRGRIDVLPTGRNFYSVDPRAIPTPTSWMLGFRSAAMLVEKHMQEHGDYLVSLGLSLWGTATMRTGGDDIAQAFALLGVRPVWASGSQRVSDFEILPLDLLDRPRVDVTLRVSGFFRDAFAHVMHLFDAAVQAVAACDEPAHLNPVRARILAETAAREAAGLPAEQARREAGHRIFSAAPGAYGAGLQHILENGQWQNDADLANAYLHSGGYAYSQQVHGAPAHELFAQRLSLMDAVMQNQDNHEHDLLDSDAYYQFQGGMTAAIRHFRGQQPAVYHGDLGNPHSPGLRTLQQEISRVVRARVTNPKWLEGMMRHGYKGASEMAATVDYLYAFDATARVVRDDQYASVSDALVNNARVREFMQHHNPQAFHGICERLLEATTRGLWNAPGHAREALVQHLLDTESRLESLA